MSDKRSLNDVGLRGEAQSRFVVAMKTFLSFSLLLTVALAHPDYSDSWSEFKLKYNKNYQSEEDEVSQTETPQVTKLTLARPTARVSGPQQSR